MEPILDDLDELELSDEDVEITESEVTQSEEEKKKSRKTAINSESEELSINISDAELDDRVGIGKPFAASVVQEVRNSVEERSHSGLGSFDDRKLQRRGTVINGRNMDFLKRMTQISENILDKCDANAEHVNNEKPMLA